MGFFKNKDAQALAMLGSFEVVEAIINSKSFDEYNISLVKKDYATIEELIDGIKENKRAEYVFVSDSALIGIEDGKYEVIKRIREKYPDIIIAMFFNDEKHDETYRNWAFGNKVYHLYYADADGGYDFSQIAEDVSQGVLPVDNSVNLQVEEQLNKKNEIIRDKEDALQRKNEELAALEKLLEEASSKEQTKENIKEVNELENQISAMHKERELAEQQITNLTLQHESEKQQLLAQTEKEKQEYFEKVEKDAKKQIDAIKKSIKSERVIEKNTVLPMGNITIGVYCVSAGAGSTYTSICIGETMAEMGYPTAVIAYDGKQDLKYSGGTKAHYIVPATEAEKTFAYLEAVNEGFQFVILDFGNLFPLNVYGELEVGRSRVSERKEDINELLRCRYKIGVGFSSPWHVGKLNYFIDNSMFDTLSCIYAIDGAGSEKQLKNCELQICERDTEQFIPTLLRVLGLSLARETGKTKKGILKREKERNGYI